MRLHKKLITMVLVLAMVLSQGAIMPLAAEQSAYSEEIEIVNALGIMVGDESGDFAPNNNLTRAEFAKVLTVLLQINDGESAKENAWYFKTGKAVENQVMNTEKQQMFKDVPADHWAYDVIGQITSLGYMIGTSEDEFSPEENVTINQVNKVFVKLLGYEVFAERNGGYPTGYNYTASSIKLLKGINHYGETPILRGELAKMLVNMFDVEMVALGYVTDEGTASYQQSNKKFLEEKLEIFTTKGELTSTSVTGLYGESDISKGEVVIGGVVYKVAEGAEYINSFLGKLIDVYYVKDSSDRNIVLYAKISDDVDEFVVDLKDFVSFSSGTLKYYDDNDKVEKLDLATVPVIIFNGTSVNAISTEQIKEFYNGTITAINSDSKGEYDMLVIDAYRSMYVKNYANDGIVINGLLKQGVDDEAVLNLREEDNKNKVITYYKNNLPASATDVMRNSVIDVAASEGEIKVIITKETKDCTVKAVSQDIDGYFIYDEEGNGYKVADDFLKATAASIPEVGSRCVLYFNSFGEVAYAEISSADYANTGLVIEASEEGRGLKRGVKVKIFSSTGRFVEYNLAEKVTYTNSENVQEKIADSKMVPILAGLKNKLITFKQDADKNISAINEPVKFEDRKTRDQGRTGVIYQSKDTAPYRSGNMAFSAYITANTTIFSISSSVGLPEEEKYSVYTKKELDSYPDLTLTSAIAYNTNRDSLEADYIVSFNTALTTFDLAINKTPLFVVDKVKQGTNSDGDTTVMVEGTFLGNGRMPVGTKKTYKSSTGAFSNMGPLVGADTEAKYEVQKGDIISCMEIGGDVKYAALIYRRDNYAYPTNKRYADGGLVGINSGIYDNTNNSNPYHFTGSGATIEVNGYNAVVASLGANNTVATSWRFYDMFVLSADEKYITLTTQDLSLPGSVPDYNNENYTIVSIPVQTNMTQQTKKGDTYTSSAIYFTDMKTYEANLNDCSRVFMITYNLNPYKLIVLNEE